MEIPMKMSVKDPVALTQSPADVNKSIEATITAAPFIPSDLLIKESIGKKGIMWPQTYSHNHPVTSLLQTYATQRFPVDCGESWTKDLIEFVLLYGLHKSARSTEARAALQYKTADKIKQCFAQVVQYGDIKGKL